MFNSRHDSRGVSIVEVIVSVFIFITGVVSATWLIIDGQQSELFRSQQQKARYLAQEAIEVVRALYRADADLVTVGVFGLTQTDDVWTLTPGTESIGMYEREVTITRPSNSISEVSVTVTFEGVGARPRMVSLSDRLYDWAQTGGAAGDVRVSMARAYGDPGNQLNDIDMHNTSGSDVVITNAAVEWEGVALLYQIEIDGELVFDVASTSGSVSGSLIDITDVVIPALSTTTIDALVFTESVVGSDMLISLTFTDTTSKHARMEL